MNEIRVVAAIPIVVFSWNRIGIFLEEANYLVVSMLKKVIRLPDR